MQINEAGSDDQAFHVEDGFSGDRFESADIPDSSLANANIPRNRALRVPSIIVPFTSTTFSANTGVAGPRTTRDIEQGA